MSTDLPAAADLPDIALASFQSEALTASALPYGMAAAAVATPGQFVIKKGENFGKRAGVKSSGKTFIFSIPAGAIPNLSSTCFTFNVNALGVGPSLDPKWKFVDETKITMTSDTVGVFDSKASCLLLQGKPNINWKPGTKPITVTIAINKPFLAALRAAAAGDITFKVAIAGYVTPPPTSSSSDDDK